MPQFSQVEGRVSLPVRIALATWACASLIVIYRVLPYNVGIPLVLGSVVAIRGYGRLCIYVPSNIP